MAYIFDDETGEICCGSPPGYFDEIDLCPKHRNGAPRLYLQPPHEEEEESNPGAFDALGRPWTLREDAEEYAEIRREYARKRRNADKEWTPQIEAALRRVMPKCVRCRSKSDLTVDHVIPVSRGGMKVPGNVVILCRRCNVAKGTGAATRAILKAAHSFAVEWEASQTVARSARS